MTPKTKKTQSEMNEGEQWAAWLGDGAVEQRLGGQSVDATGGAVGEALDAVYAAGPGAGMAARVTARLRGRLRAELAKATAAGRVYYDVAADTPIGPVYVAVGERGVLAVRFGCAERVFTEALRQQTGQAPERSPRRAGRAARQMADYLAGRRRAFDVPVDLSASTDFQRQVLLAACQIPRGQVITYRDLAQRIGKPLAARAVGQALSRNPVPIVVPCHRVLAADGSLRGYLGSEGTATKERLLRLEGVAR